MGGSHESDVGCRNSLQFYQDLFMSMKTATETTGHLFIVISRIIIRLFSLPSGHT